MTLLPIVERELRAGSRKNAPRYIRLVVAAVALIVGLFQLTFLPIFSRAGSGGGAAFMFMTGYAFVLCVGAGIFVTADCLSEEKRAGTLGLLFLTDLRGYDVILGKLASQLIYLGYALLAIIPGAALPLLLGGVTWGELWRICLVLVNLLFFSLSAGLLASSLCRSAGTAMTFTGGILGLFCLGFPSLQAAWDSGSGPATTFWFGWASPATAYIRAMESGYVAARDRFWLSLFGSHFVSWLLVVLASRIVPRSWQDRPRVTCVLPAPQTPPSPSQGSPAPTSITLANPESTRSRGSRALLNEDPLLWLIGERKGVRAGIWAMSVIWVVAILAASLTVPWGNIDEVLFPVAGLAWALLLIAKILFTSEACRFFIETRRAGSFELLLAAPINANRFITAQWVALRRTFAMPMLVAVGGSLLALAISATINGTQLDEVVSVAAVGGIFGGLWLMVQGLDFFALGWLGIWLALTMRKPHLAVGATLLYVIILPWFIACYSLFIGLILDIVLIAVFASKLRADFRFTLMNRPTLAAPTPGAIG